MMGAYRVTAVEGPREWEWQGQPNHDYTLTLEGAEKPAILTQRPSTAPPRVGETMDLELSAHPRFDDKLKAKRAKQFGGGGGGGGRSPEENARIMRQHSQEMALRYAAIKASLGSLTADFKPETLKPIIDWFDADAKAAQP